jgi:GAF domain-containing protein
VFNTIMPLRIALPLRFEEIVGILTICSKQANAFDVAEVELLKELAETLSHGLMSLRARSLLKQTNERLQGNERSPIH